jgi:muramidase (phage lysozyme)
MIMASVPASVRPLLDLIRSAEAGPTDQYNVIFAHHERTIAKKITAMTLAELQANQALWAKQWPSTAAGGYQIIQSTLKGLMSKTEIAGSALFTPALQDALAFQLLLGRGWANFIAGTLSTIDFGKALAQEWASFPVLSATKGAHGSVARGVSYYAGDSLNAAQLAPERVEAVLKQCRIPATVPPSTPAPPVSPPSTLKDIQMNLSLLTLLISYLPLLPYLQADVMTEVKVLTGSSDGEAKARQTLAVLKDVIAQIEAVLDDKAIPPATAPGA